MRRQLWRDGMNQQQSKAFLGKQEFFNLSLFPSKQNDVCPPVGERHNILICYWNFVVGANLCNLFGINKKIHSANESFPADKHLKR